MRRGTVGARRVADVREVEKRVRERRRQGRGLASESGVRWWIRACTAPHTYIEKNLFRLRQHKKTNYTINYTISYTICCLYNSF